MPFVCLLLQCLERNELNAVKQNLFLSKLMSSPENQWFGFEIPGKRFGLPLSSISSIFHLGNREQMGWLEDHLEVYEGVPVFLVAPHKLFNFEQSTAWQHDGSLPLTWAIILKNKDDAHIGFRASKTYGPFESTVSDDGMVQYGDVSIPLIELVEMA
jgi:hypothetical protein